MKSIRIRFTNMKGRRVGKGISELRQQRKLSPKQLAERVGIDDNYLQRLEEGYVPEVDFETLENIARALGVCERGKLTPEQLINYFMDATKEDQQPILI